jgi:hypothetical protein
MSKLRATLKWGFVSALALLIVITAAWAVSRAMYPTEAQQEAIAEMRQQPEHEGDNAFALLWTLDRDVPDDELEAVMAEDARDYADNPPSATTEEDGVVSLDPTAAESAADDYPDLMPSSKDSAMFCRSRRKDCLERVREDPEAYAALIERNRTLLDRAERLQDFGYIRSELPHRMTGPLPAYQPAAYLRTQRAVAFVRGRPREAIAGLCTDIATWRRLGARSDHLIGRMIGISNTTNHSAYTLANILAERPPGEPLPESCDAALAPPTVEDVSICNAMRGEFAVTADAIEQVGRAGEESNFVERLAMTLLLDNEATLGISAQGFHSLCSEEEESRLRADRREVPEPENESLWRFTCVGNFVGCTLTSIAWPAYTDYRLRAQDYGARLRVLGTLAWMRRHADDGRSPAELLAARPDDLKSPSRDIEFGPDGQTLRVAMYNDKRSEYWSIPLPPALYPDQSR